MESGSFEKYVLNVGDRQKGRQRGSNVLDCKVDATEMLNVLAKIKDLDKLDSSNIYGDGKSSDRMIEILKKLE